MTKTWLRRALLLLTLAVVPAVAFAATQNGDEGCPPCPCCPGGSR